MPHLYSHASVLLSAPSGVLLFGPPGCGKTMLAKALARESGASFINLHISTITEKWYGDSNKIVRAVFSLARKVEPAIIFIDEVRMNGVCGREKPLLCVWEGKVLLCVEGKAATVYRWTRCARRAPTTSPSRRAVSRPSSWCRCRWALFDGCGTATVCS